MRPNRRTPRPPRKVDPAYLRRVAVWYLERWNAPPAGLRRILMKRVRRSVDTHGTDPDQAASWVEDVVQEAIAAGLTRDDLYAEAMVRTLRGRGASARAIRARLRAKGVEAQAIDDALTALDADSGDRPELTAALRYARRRRFGPWRAGPADDDRRRKELSALARQGFSFQLARTVVDQGPDDREAAEDRLWDARV